MRVHNGKDVNLGMFIAECVHRRIEANRNWNPYLCEGIQTREKKCIHICNLIMRVIMER